MDQSKSVSARSHPDEDLEIAYRTLYRNDRLSMPTPLRIGSAFTGAFLIGGTLGLSHGSKMSGMRFRAENSHRFPTTSTGWYLYHKTKNYHVMLGGIKEGLKMALRTSIWTGAFFVVEDAVDRLRNRQDCFSSMIAGLTIAGNFSWLNKLPIQTAVRTLRLGLFSGLVFGLTQDALSLARGRQIDYIDFMSDKITHFKPVGQGNSEVQSR